MIIVKLLSLLFTSTTCFSLSTSISPLVSYENVVKRLFHTEEVGVKISHQDTIIRTFNMFHNASLKEVIPALEKVVSFLLIQEHKYNDHNQLRNELTSTIVTIQRQHISKYCASLYERLTLYEKILLLFYKKSISWVASIMRLFKKTYESPIEKLAYQLEWYTFFEREHVLIDYNSALHFFSKQYNTTFPPCFAFWKENSDKVKILVLLQKLNTTITTQEEMIAEMGLSAAGDATKTLIGATMDTVAEATAETVVQTVGKEITESVVAETASELTDTVIDSQAAIVEDAAPTMNASMESTESELASSAEDDASLLEDAGGGEFSEPTPRGKKYYKQQKASFKQKIGDLDSKIRQADKSMGDISGKMSKVGKDIKGQTKALGDAKSKLAALKDNPEATSAEIEAAQEQVNLIQSKISDLNAKSNSLMKDYESASRSKFQMMTERTSLKVSLKQLLAEEAAEEAAEVAAQKSGNAAEDAHSPDEHGGDGTDGEGGDGEGEDDEYVPKKTGADRLQELKDEHNAKMQKLKDTYQDKSKGFFTRAKAYLTFGFKKVATPLRWVDDRMDAFVSSKASNSLHKNFGGTLKKVSDNPIRAAIQSLPPSWQGIAEMMIQMEAMQATSIVAFWYEQDNEEEYEQWQQQQLGMSQLNTKFTSLMTVQQKQNLNLANQTFLNNLKILSLDKQQEQALCVFSQQWIEQAIFSSPPSSFFTAQSANIGNNNLPAIDDDYEFELSSMITPDTMTTGIFIPTSPNAWHNIYRTGNWQFLSSNNTFCQLALAPVTASSVIAQANQVLGNSIFREYIPPQQLMYPVSAKCTLYTYQFPFFFGLLFNKGRWLAGITDRQQQTRFTGLFGAPDKKIYFVCEESRASSSQEIQQGAPSTQSPFYRILNNPALYAIEKNIFSPGPLPCKTTITATSYDLIHPTLANTVTATLTSSATPITQFSITNKNFSTSNGLQHGVGFVSAGCIGSFIITSPQDLVYTPHDLALMNKNLATILNSTQG